ncbi:hypothetical protein DQ04_16861000 [Trypanosoma grayi]|uniref:hypothetical protein n=1 Tax=Trypanosoma grayi TaxID=71804 RepID=UPI0004F4B201|nr:hypothetical protein DQ04_16861000 [Trypanosoma grayi]KEG05976.1 hypothetical protein DQ04_16861000 [Trypanosoma grayi]
MALETTLGAVLQEEEILHRCFGIAAENGDDVAEANEDSNIRVVTPFNGSVMAACETDAAVLLAESLLELFGGDKLVQFPSSGTASAYTSPQLRGSEVEFGSRSTTTNPEAGSNNGRGKPQKCFLQQQLVSFAEYCGAKCDRLYAVPVMVMVKAYKRDGTPTAASALCQQILQALERVVASTISRCVAEQTASIAACRKRYVVHPAGMLCCFTKLPAFVQRMEAVHNALPQAVRSRTEYAAVALSFVDQAFEALNYISSLASPEAGGHVRLNLIEAIARRANKLIDGLDTKSIKRVFLQQYRHHAFFCAFYASLPPSSYAVELLRERNDASLVQRDRYEEVYLTRVVLVKDFPEFGTFALVAEDLAQVHSREELRHHNALSVEEVRRIVRCLPREVRNGIPSSSRRMKKHFLRDVAGRQEEESFHCTLLQRVWQHFCTLFLQKIDFLESLLRWPLYAGIEMPITHAEISQLLQAA